MEDLKRYFDALIRRDSYRGWHIIQADTTTHDSITKSLHAIAKLSVNGQLQATDETLSQINQAIGRGASALPVRKQLLVNLNTFGLITREGQGQEQIIMLTPRAHEYLNYENKEFYMDRILEDFEIKVPNQLHPFPIMLRTMSDKRFTSLKLREFQYFISQIKDESEINAMLINLTAYRSLSETERSELEGYVKQLCEQIDQQAISAGRDKYARRDYHNWASNAKHSLEFFSLGSQIKLVGDSVHLLLGSDELKQKILQNLKLLEQKAKVQKQTVHFRDKKVMDDLKKLYSYYCQFCGYNYVRIPTKEGYYVEAAHIVPVSEQHLHDADLNDPTNIVIACANHHKTIDRHYPEFRKQIVVFEDGRKGLETVDGSERLYLTLNEHI